jgi:hypothetical protein
MRVKLDEPLTADAQDAADGEDLTAGFTLTPDLMRRQQVTEGKKRAVRAEHDARSAGEARPA